MPDILVVWYDDYGVPHNSPIYFVDSVRDRFLVANEDKKFLWVPTDDCEIIEEPKRRT